MLLLLPPPPLLLLHGQEAQLAVGQQLHQVGL
jgi:hypothetical protein